MGGIWLQFFSKKIIKGRAVHRDWSWEFGTLTSIVGFKCWLALNGNGWSVEDWNKGIGSVDCCGNCVLVGTVWMMVIGRGRLWELDEEINAGLPDDRQRGSQCWWKCQGSTETVHRALIIVFIFCFVVDMIFCICYTFYFNIVDLFCKVYYFMILTDVSILIPIVVLKRNFGVF